MTRSRDQPVFDMGTFLTLPEEIFLLRSVKNGNSLGFLGEIFQTQTQIKDG